MEQRGVRDYIRCVMRSVVMCVVFWLMFEAACVFLSFSCYDIGAERRLLDGGCALAFVVALNTVLGKFAQFDRREKRLFLQRADKTVGFSPGTEVRRVVRSHVFWIEVLTFSVTFAILPPSWGPGCLPGVVFGQVDWFPLVEQLFIIAVTVPLTVGLNLISYVEARHVWIETGIERRGDPSPVERLVKWMILGTVTYCLGFFVLPYLIKPISSVLQIVRFVEAWRIIPAFVVIVLIFAAIAYFRAFLHRRRFVRRLKRFCRGQHFELSRIRGAYRSVFWKHDGVSFTVVAHKKIYACKLIASVKHTNPVELTQDGRCLHSFILRFKHMRTELFRIVRTTDYRFEEKGSKILVVTPVPKKLFFEGGEMDNGDRIGEYTVFSGGGFMRALERDCIERCGMRKY